MCNSRDCDNNLTFWGEYLYEKLEFDNKFLFFAYLIFYSLIFVISLSSNLLTCYVIYTKKSMHTPMNCYIFNLAICDLVCTMTFIVLILYYFYNMYEKSGWVCTLNWILMAFLWNYSILLLTTVAIERYLVIFHPLLMQTKDPFQRASKVVIFVWILAMLESVPEFWIVQVIPSRKLTLCLIAPTPFLQRSGIILVSVTYFIPLGIMFLVYTLIAYKVNSKTWNPIKSGQVFNYPDNRRVTKLAVALTVSFFITWLPVAMLRLTLSMHSSMNDLIHISKWYVIWSRLTSLSSGISLVLNPILFSLFSTKFRQALKGLRESGRLNNRQMSTKTTTTM